MNARNPESPGLTPRQREILRYAREHGEVLVEPLARRFDVTPQTIRRDLNELCSLRLLQRMHGGATASGGVSNLGYAARQRLAEAEKAAIGERAARLIPNDASVFVNIGTTTEQVVRHLNRHAGLLVITNNVHVVNQLRSFENVRMMIAGGVVREDGGIVGDQTVDFIEQFKVDFAVMGVSAIEDDGTLLDFDPLEVRASKAILEHARSVILVADAMKFQRGAPVRIGHISQVDHFVTDRPPPDAFLEVCARHDVRVEVCGVAGEPEPAAAGGGRAP